MSALASRRPTVTPASGLRPKAPVGPLRHALEGAAAALCAVVAMSAVSVLALYLLDADSAGSLWSLAMAVTAMSVGGSVTGGSQAETSGGSGLADMLGGGMSPSMDGTADAVPLGVTLVGALVLWQVFSRPLRQRRFDVGDLGVRALGAVAAALLVFLAVAGSAHGTFQMPESVTSGMRDGGGEGASGGLGSGGLGGEGLGSGAGGLGDLLGGLFGGDRAVQEPPAMTFQAQAGWAAVGALLWVAVVLAVGCLVTRRVPLHRAGALSRLRVGWGPSVSAVVRMFLVLSVVPLLAAVFVGAMAGGRGATAAGAALLLTPNVVAVFLTLGLGASWTAETHPVQSQDGNPLTSLFGQLGGQRADAPRDRVEHLGDLSPGGFPLWLGALVIAAIALLACGYTAARTTATVPTQLRPLHPYRGPHARHLGRAERLAIVTAVTMGAAALLVEASGHFGYRMFGSEMGGMRAQLSGSVPYAVLLGLVAGGLAGLAGSLLSAALTGRPRIFARKSPAAADSAHPVSSPSPSPGPGPGPGRGPGPIARSAAAADSGSLEEPIGNR